MSAEKPSEPTVESLVKLQNPWVVGDIIAIPDLATYHNFETTLIDYMPHETTHEFAWQGRIKIEELVRPKKFFGRIADIELVYIGDPRVRIHNSETVLQTGQQRNALSDASDITQKYMFGFDFLAGIYSTGRGRIGTVQSFIAYAPPVISSDGKFTRNYGIRRVASKPIVDTVRPLDQMRQESINNALKLQRIAIQHPYLGLFESRRSPK